MTVIDKDVLKKMLGDGMTVRGISKATGWNRIAVYKAAYVMGIKPSASTSSQPDVDRNRELLVQFDAGEKLECIAATFGITRERVRQIAAKAGRTPRANVRRQSISKREDAILSMVRQGKTNRETAEALGLHIGMVRDVVSSSGLTAAKGTYAETRADDIAEAVRLIAGGMSMTKACTAVNLPRGAHYLVSTAREKAGIPHQHGRWGRDPLTLRRVKEAAKSTKRLKVALKRKKDELRVLVDGLARAEVRPAKPIASRLTEQPIPIDPAKSAREVCWELRGKYTASQIADALGTTRNAVIGHWFREKNSTRRTKNAIASPNT